MTQTNPTPEQRISQTVVRIAQARSELKERRAELRGALGRVESRFRQLASTFASELDPYSGSKFIEVDLRERGDGEHALTVRMLGEYFLELGVHERQEGQESDIRRGFYASSNVTGAYARQFHKYLTDMCGLVLIKDEPMFAFVDRQDEEHYSFPPENLFALFLENALLEIEADARIYNQQ